MVSFAFSLEAALAQLTPLFLPTLDCRRLHPRLLYYILDNLCPFLLFRRGTARGTVEDSDHSIAGLLVRCCDHKLPECILVAAALSALVVAWQVVQVVQVRKEYRRTIGIARTAANRQTSCDSSRSSKGDENVNCACHCSIEWLYVV